MSTLVIFVLFASWLALLAVGIWALARINAQYQRMRDAPTPQKAFGVLTDLQAASDLELLAVKRKCENNEMLIADLQKQIVQMKARYAAQEKRDQQLDLRKLGDYIQAQTEETGEQPDIGVPPVSTVFRDQNGDVIDYR